MNKVYSLRYSDVAQGFIAVSEFARKCVHKPFRRLSFPVVLLSPSFSLQEALREQ